MNIDLGQHATGIIQSALALITLASIVAVGAWLWKKRKEAKAVKEADPEAEKKGPTPEEIERQKRIAQRRGKLRALFSRELARLKANSTGRDSRYRVPWCLMLGSHGSGQTTALKNTGLHVPFASEDADAEAGCTWHFFDKGLVIDVDGASLTDDDYFQSFLSILRKERPRRPLDSLILSVPVTAFTDPQIDVEALRKRAEFLASRLGQLQKVLALRVPVYVLVTMADKVPGFVQYCGALAGVHREQIVGWSSPYSQDAPYKAEWIDEAFDEVYRTQNLILIDLLAAGKISAQERDAAFLFPRNIRNLKSQARVFFDQLFKSSVYSEPSIFRGFFFSGDASVKGVMVQADEGEDAQKKPSFLHHLFAKKIFPEHSLAQPLRSSLASIGVMVNVARSVIALFSIVGIAVLWSTCSKLNRDATTVAEFMERIPTKVGPAAQPDRDVSQDTQLLLRAMAGVSTNKLRRSSLPSSWVSDIDDQVRELMKDSFELVVLSGLRHGLTQKARKLFGNDEPVGNKVRGRPADPRRRPTPAAVDEEDDTDLAPLTPQEMRNKPAKVVQIPPIQAIQSMQEYQNLLDLAKSFGEFSRNVEVYNQLGTERRKKMETVAPLVRYAFDVDLGDGFKLDSALYQEALENAKYPEFDLRTVTPRVERRARELAESLQRRLFLENPIDLELSEIERSINRLQTEGQWEGADKQTLQYLRDMIGRVGKDLEQPEMAWLTRETLDLGPAYQDLISSLNRISLDGRKGLGEDIQREWQESFLRLRTALADHKAPEMGALIVAGEKGKIQLAKGLVDVKLALDAFFAQSYVLLSDREATTRAEGASYRVTWNEDMLRQAIQLSDIYGVFVRDRLGTIYPVIRGVVKSTAKEMLGKSMPALISQARRSERVANNNAISQDELSVEVTDLKRVTALLKQVLETYEKVGLSTQYADLSRQIGEDCRQILTRLDILFDKEEMYRTSRRLARWAGQRPPALDAFDVDDPEALSQYIKTQRNRMKTWARDFAAAPVGMIEGLSGGSEGQLSRWKSIVRELESYEKMTPNNSVKDLETLIEGTMLSLTPENCVDKLPRRSADRVDYFQQQYAKVYNEMRRRCMELGEERLRDDFRKLAEQFKRDLEGRFPFSRRRVKNDDEDADIRDVRAFYQAFDDYDKKYRAYRSNPNVEIQTSGADSTRKIDGFLESIRYVRPFFAALISDKSGDTVPRYSLGLEFRVNRDKEINGQQIGEWSLSIGDQRIEESQAVWQAGDKIKLGMRWAKDGPFRPAQAGQPRGSGVDGDNIYFEWGGQWALLRFIRYHLSQETDLGRTDTQPHVLKFSVQIEERKKSGRLRLLPDEYYIRKGVAVNTQNKNAYISTKAVVFARFRVSLPESKDFIVFKPDRDWPAEAPVLETKSQ